MTSPNAPEAEPHPRLKRVRIVLGLTLIGLVVQLVFGENPWQDGIAKAEREGHKVLSRDIAETWLWWTAAANLLLVGALLATTPIWLRSSAVPEVASLVPRPPGRLFIGLVAVLVAVGAFFVQPRLGFSWWDDEEATVRRHIDGYWQGIGTDDLHYKTVPWVDTLWKDSRSNNHVGFTVLSRLSLGTWRLVARPTSPLASETAVRMPSFLAALGAVVFTALLGWRLGFAAAGVAAAGILVLHPWFTRYGAEARGYAMVLCLVPVVWILLLNALQRGTWGRWLAFGVAQVVLLSTHMGCAVLAIVTNAAAAVALFVFHRGTPQLREQSTRFLVTNMLAAGAWAQLMLPNFLQVLDYLVDWRGRYGVSPVMEVLGHFLVGVQMKTGDPRHVTVVRIAEAWPLLLRAVAVLAPLAAVAGAVRAARSSVGARILLPAMLLPAPIAYTMAWIQDDRFYEAYLAFALPGLFVLVAAGLSWPLTRIPRPTGPRLAAATLALFLAGYGVLTHAGRAGLRAGSFVTTREAVLLTRPSLDPFAAENQEIITASFSWPPIYYDPLVRWVDTTEGLEALMAEADSRGVPLYVNNRRPHQALQSFPELVAIVEHSGRFDKIGDLPGFEKRGHHVVYRYLGPDGQDAERRQTP